MQLTLKLLHALTLCILPMGGFATTNAQEKQPSKAKVNAASETPSVGGMAEDFELDSVDGTKMSLSEATKEGPVVLVVLRGNPGYQCPLCTRQVGELIRAASELENRTARVVLVYPGPKKELTEKAAEFLQNINLPSHFVMVTDPDYTFTDKYHLRWKAKNETAYPSTFVIDTEGKFSYVKISKGHGDRAEVKEVLDAIP
jgi:thioredoxin-dependent peroxiredoxin